MQWLFSLTGDGKNILASISAWSTSLNCIVDLATTQRSYLDHKKSQQYVKLLTDI